MIDPYTCIMYMYTHIIAGIHIHIRGTRPHRERVRLLIENLDRHDFMTSFGAHHRLGYA